MNLRIDPETAFAEARPDDSLPGTTVDIKRVMRDGYRARRRNRAVVGGAAATGVGAVAAVLALSVLGLPGAEPPRFPAGKDFPFDPAQAGYPSPAFGDSDVNQPELQEAANDVFGDLAVDAGFLDAGALDYELPSEAEVEAAMDEYDLGYYGALSELGYLDLPLQFGLWNAPGNGGQVYLRGYIAQDGDEEAEQSSFTVTALQPGGWTAEPGPTGDVAFPQHLISDEASWTGEAPEFTTVVMDDGRTLMVADHGCALEAAVVYPNGSALRSTWDLDCAGQGREMTVDELSDAMLAMPQIDYDTAELQPVDDLVEFPPGWAYDEQWETAAAADADASFDAATTALDAAHPGVRLTDSGAIQLELFDTVQRTYTAEYEMPFDDASGNTVTASVRYYLPGGWLPGLRPEGSSSQVYLLDCGGPEDDSTDVCDQSEVDGRTVATRTSEPGAEAVETTVVVFDPAGWAVSLGTLAEGDLDGYALEDLVALTASLPAPVYDPAEYER
jgi:hypothetical protein